MLGMRTFYKGGVMIHRFGPRGHLWMPTCHTILGRVGVVAFRVNVVPLPYGVAQPKTETREQQ